MSDEDAVGFQDELEISWNLFEDSLEMRAVKCRLVAADSKVKRIFFASDGEEVLNHLFRSIELPHPVGLGHHFPRPAEEASQTTADTIRGSNATVVGCWPKSIVFSFLS